MGAARAGAPGSRRGGRVPSDPRSPARARWRRRAPLTYDVRVVFIILDPSGDWAYLLSMPAKTKTAKPFADLDAALDLLCADELCSTIETATDEIRNAESVETMADFELSLATAEQALAEALKRVRDLRARAIATIGGE